MPSDNLPVQVTPFIGRTTELAEIAQLLTDPACRLLTLVGPGGIGKTRLALEAAAAQQVNFADGVYFVGLAPVNLPDLVAPSIAGALKISFYGSEHIVGYLHNQHMLLLLDNFEHLMGATSLLTNILESAPTLKLLITSRERLNVQEEWVFPVEGMHYPGETNR